METLAVFLQTFGLLAVAESGLVVVFPGLEGLPFLLDGVALAVVQDPVLAIDASACLGASGACEVALAVFLHAFGFLAIATFIAARILRPYFLGAARLL